MTLEIISAHEVKFNGDVESVSLPGALGNFTVLKNHASLISVLTPGKVAYRTPKGDMKEIMINGGIADVDNNKVSVCIN